MGCATHPAPRPSLADLFDRRSQLDLQNSSAKVIIDLVGNVFLAIEHANSSKTKSRYYDGSRCGVPLLTAFLAAS